MLKQYYRGPGSQDSLRIVLSSGSYKPQFEDRSGGPTSAAKEEGERSSSRRRFGWPCARRFATIFVTVSLAIASAAVIVRSRQPARATEVGWSYPGTPVVVVRSARDVGATRDRDGSVQREQAAVESQLGAFDDFVVDRGADLNGRNQPNYELSIGATATSGAVSDWTFELIYSPTSEIVWSRSFPQVSPGDATVMDRMTDAVVSAVGDPELGAIIADQRKRAAILNIPLQGYACLLAARDYLLTRDQGTYVPVRECLEREVSLNARNPQALRLLSTILVVGFRDLMPGNRELADVERAETLAQRAFELAPNRSQTSAAVFLSRFYNRQFDDAFASAPLLRENFPKSRALLALVGAAYIARGRYDEGTAIPLQLEDLGPGASAFAVPMLALAAYMHGDEAAAERFASRAVGARLPMGLVMRIVMCEREMKAVCVNEASQQLRRDYPGFAADIRTALFRYALADEIRTALLSDLHAAGFFGEASR